MSQSLFFAMLLLLGTVFTGCKQDNPEPNINTPATKNAVYTYLALGDSYTIGQSVPVADQWGMQLADLLRKDGLDISNPVTIARTGWTTSELTKATQEANLNPTFDLVTLLIGVNNQYRGQPLATYRTEFSALLQTSVKLAEGKPKQVLVLSIPDWGATPFGSGNNRQRIAEEIDAFNSAAKEIAQEAGVTFINITPLTREFGNDPTYLASDGLHYSGKMHREWALLTLPKAKEALQ